MMQARHAQKDLAMVQVRQLVLAIAAATALSSGMAQALELGELTLKSAPNQPLVAEIELRDVAQLTAPEIVPGLASPEEFARAGLDRQAFLNQLSFTPVINPGGRSVIQVTSSAPIAEPLLKFLVQVIYPSGRLMRDYSVLVDASKFSPQAAEPATPPATPAVTAPAASTGREYTTTPRDTLWEIAARFREQASVQQTMLAIQAMNPSAFQDANINRLRAGQVLRIPDNSDATALAQPQAIAEVARQNAAWREGRRLGPRAQQLDATRSNGRGTAPPPAQVDNLKLVSGDATAANAKGLAGDNKVLSDKLAVTQEGLDSARRENGELQSRLADLQSQLDKANRLLQLKSDQLARLEAGASATPQPEAPVAVPDATAPAAEAPATPAEGQPAVDAQLVPPPQAPAATPDPATAPVASPAQPAEEEPSSPWLLGTVAGLAVAAALLAAWLLARRRRAQQESERHARMARELAEAQEFRPGDFDAPVGSFDSLGTASPSVRLAPAMVAASAAAAAAAEASAGEAPVYARPSRVEPRDELPSVASLVVAPAASDPLEQAQDHIDHDRYMSAREVLEGAIRDEPERSDLRFKLMEVYGQLGERDGFIAQERHLMANGASPVRVDELKARFPAMAGLAGLSAAAVAAELDAQYVKDLLQDEADAPAPIGDVFDTNFDLSLDGIEPRSEDATPQDVTPEEGVPPMAELAAPRDELDFDTLLRESAAERAGAEPVPEGEPAPVVPALPPVDTLDNLGPSDHAPADISDEEAARRDRERLDDFDLALSSDQQDDHERFAADVNDVNAQLDELSHSLAQPPVGNGLHTETGTGEGLDEFDFLSDSDEVTTKLDLARAYIEMADAEGARDILDEVLKEGTTAQQKEARKMLAALS
jgi:pilus assembly protein FimV